MSSKTVFHKWRLTCKTTTLAPRLVSNNSILKKPFFHWIYLFYIFTDFNLKHYFVLKINVYVAHANFVKPPASEPKDHHRVPWIGMPPPMDRLLNYLFN